MTEDVQRTRATAQDFASVIRRPDQEIDRSRDRAAFAGAIALHCVCVGSFIWLCVYFFRGGGMAPIFLGLGSSIIGLCLPDQRKGFLLWLAVFAIPYPAILLYVGLFYR